MMSDFSLTFLFKNIFPTYDKFKEFTDEYIIDADDIFLPTAYKWLFNRFANSNVAYDTEDAFKRHFANELDDCLNMMKFRQDRLKALYALTDDDLALVNVAFATVANAPNTEQPEALDKLLDYVNTQSANKLTTNKFESLLRAIENIADRGLEDWLNRFQRHFIRIYPRALDVYEY